jgi:small subunit ribosomal protein S13|uniref:Small ribosomal subunit protein uS13c n=2 Tax=Cyanidioschyzon merolae TaxID=45157 RepID=RR13_CYAM1|nr:ribosomal protein S13 [Cyanidioschyzon merolae strain 10D]P59758.1 RecName: Full=Small ribosomal subunit protein uS13c; AltName: Full=30S ribosomal protein S13, chloroplastic [Cyanidioschyzon merolae strain 10D]QFV17212.1 30S ribosomal protein S13 [Cyanidioschyzon merolae]BAC76250.1 30S ribosomal protein S13 [Cyanidioschyzon merolae strain 10D]
MRIAGVDLPSQKKLEVALTYLYGIGKTLAKEILEACQLSPDLRVRDVNDEQSMRLRQYIEQKYLIESDLKRVESMNIKRLMDIGCYRGRRHRALLPVRGQRTRSNARTRRGAKKTVAGKKLAK